MRKLPGRERLRGRRHFTAGKALFGNRQFLPPATVFLDLRFLVVFAVRSRYSVAPEPGPEQRLEFAMAVGLRCERRKGRFANVGHGTRAQKPDRIQERHRLLGDIAKARRAEQPREAGEMRGSNRKRHASASSTMRESCGSR